MNVGRITLVLLVFFGLSMMAREVSGGQPKARGVCNLPELAQGAHQRMRIAAVAEAGTDTGVLWDASCPSIQPLWFELSLRSERNRKKFHDEIEKTGKAAVILSGELYGPPLPDSKVPEPIRKNYRGGWGHLGSFPMKLVVFNIESVTTWKEPKQ